MKTLRYMIVVLLLATISACSSGNNESLFTFQLQPGSEREIAYTDKGDAIWVTRSGGYNNSPWHGLSASKRAYLEDLFIYADGILLPREQAEVSVDPVSLIRYYPALGIRETWTLLDERRTLVVQLEAERATHWTVQPAIMGGSTADDFEINTSDAELNAFIQRLADIPASYPHLKIWFSESMAWSPAISPEKTLYTSFLTPRADHPESKDLTISVSLNKDSPALKMQVGWIDDGIDLRGDRIKTRMGTTKFSSNLPELDKAIAWAHNSLDALVMNQMGKGIYAGLPWFDDYWGRDAFISFPGAVLVSGQFEDARDILLSFAELQNVDASDQDYGRVPNRAQPENIIYNTTDGTPWFVRSVWEYYRYSGDTAFLKRMWPSVRHATLGALQNWIDESGLLRHTDADTWMDAKGPDGPWSPRGDRAIDIQFMWQDQLEITRKLAVLYDDEALAKMAGKTLAKSKAALQQYVSADGSHYVDHLNSDDSQDSQIRPNVFLVPALLDETCDWSSFKTLAPQLITRKGVLSLSQHDSNFHPYHHQPGLYVQDAAYHNGIIWTWNSAATISQAVRYHQYHYAEALFDDLSEQILTRGAIGTIAELTDAWPKEGELRLSGTFSQAWSLAEYLRSFYQDILGVQPDMASSQVKLAPRLFDDMRQIKFKHPIGNDIWDIKYEDSESAFEISLIRMEELGLKLQVELLTGQQISQLDIDWETPELHLRYEKQMGQWTVPDAVGEYRISVKPVEIKINGLPFCELDTSIEVAALAGPEYRLLMEHEMLNFQSNLEAIKKLSDPAGDDTGLSGTYVYPGNPQFEAGIADILSIDVSENESSYGFEMEFANLVDPGWHPEYGYQLTYCALGISYSVETGTQDIGKNAGTVFQNGFKADQIVYVSGGVLLVDDKHEPLAEYMPVAASGAIGNAKSNLVRFTLPRELFKESLNSAQLQVAVGCQDDHGGAGIGDFRPVEALGSEWAGGGKSSASESNVYDWLLQ